MNCPPPSPFSQVRILKHLHNLTLGEGPSRDWSNGLNVNLANTAESIIVVSTCRGLFTEWVFEWMGAEGEVRKKPANRDN